MEKVYDMLIIGGGPGGYTAALYAARSGLSVAVIEKFSPGGQMALTGQIDNYPGFPEGIDGFTLSQQILRQAEQFGAETVYAQVTAVSLEKEIKEITTDSGLFYGKTVVIATGASPRLLGLPEEPSLTGRGVHYCAHCDGVFYRGKTVVVVGGGNSAAADALLLSRVAEKVILVHRRDTLRATKIYHKPLMESKNITFLWNSRVESIAAGGKVEGVIVENLETGEKVQIPADGVFVSIGRMPASGLFEKELPLDEGGYIIAGEDTQTPIPGVYAIGDVRTKQLRQIVTAVADGAMAAAQAEQYLA